MDGVRDLERAVREFGAVAATFFPAGKNPQVPINDKKVFPFYAKCVELDIPIFVCAGIPGPRVPAACQDVMLIDEVCWYFPELKFVTRHGCEPWQDLAVKLMLKWPNLYYSTSAFAPKHYPQAIIDYANTRGADKIIYAGYFPMGLSLERIFSELPARPVQGRGVAEVPPAQRRPGPGDRGRLMTTPPTPASTRSRFPSAGSASPTPTTSPRARRSPATTSVDISSSGATPTEASTSRTPSAPISAPISATVARRSTDGLHHLPVPRLAVRRRRAPTPTSRTPSGPTARRSWAPTRPSSATA